MRKRNACLPGLAKNISPLKTDLRKKSGFGPREIQEDDQSKEAAITRFEMGEYKVNPTITNMEDPKQREELYKRTEVNRR